MYKLVTHKDMLNDLQFSLTRKVTVIGRDPICDIVLSDDSVSRRHAQIQIVDRKDLHKIVVVDMNSSNGTLVNDQPIEHELEIKLDDQILIGRTRFVLKTDDDETDELDQTLAIPRDRPDTLARTAPTATGEITAARLIDTLILSKEEIKDSAEDKQIPTIEIEDEKGAKRTYQLPEGETIIGRSKDCQFMIEDPAASGIHAELIRKGDNVSLTDLNSTNGTFVDGNPAKRVPLYNGYKIRIGNTTIKFTSALEQPEPVPEEPVDKTPTTVDLDESLDVLEPVIPIEPIVQDEPTETEEEIEQVEISDPFIPKPSKRPLWSTLLLILLGACGFIAVVYWLVH